MKKTVYILLALLLLLSVTIPVFANSAEPPGIIILSNDLPENATLTLLSIDGLESEFRRITYKKVGWESQYRLWLPFEFKGTEKMFLRIQAGETGLTVPLPDDTVNRYKTVLTLDFSEGTLTLGQEAWRQPVLTTIRIVLTLLAEGLVFFAFGFRNKRTWILFLILNLLTQVWLNHIINGNAFASGYWMIVYYLAEIVIFVGEAVAIGLLVKEQKTWKRVICTLLANAVSLALGILLISNLPI